MGAMRAPDPPAPPDPPGGSESFERLRARPARGALRVSDARALDRWALDVLGLPGLVLMENAGGAAARELPRLLAKRPGEVWILAGPGNNGGDGWVVARHSLCAGHAVRVLCTRPPDELVGDAHVMARAALALGVSHTLVREAEPWERAAREACGRAAIVVDALLGTGASGGARGAVRCALESFEALRVERVPGRPLVVALDVPSGLDADVGVPREAVLCADLTVTFAAPKVGLLRPAARRFVGELVVASLGIPAWPDGSEQSDLGAEF